MSPLISKPMPKSKFTRGEDRFELRVAFETLRHCDHAIPDAAHSSHVTLLVGTEPLSIKVLPLTCEAFGARWCVDAQFGFKAHRLDRALDAGARGFVGERMVGLVGALDVARIIGAEGVERAPGFRQFVAIGG